MYQESKFQEWKYKHNDAWVCVRVILIAIPLLTLLFIAVESYNENTWIKWEESMDKLPCEKVWEFISRHEHYHQKYYDYYGQRCY